VLAHRLLAGVVRVVGTGDAAPLALTSDQFTVLVLGLPWQRVEQMRVLTWM